MEKDIWQYSLTMQKEDEKYISWLKNKLQNCVLRAKGEFLTICQADNISCIISLPTAQKLVLKPIICSLVAELLLDRYKEKFLEKSFDFYVNKDVLYHAFVKALGMFDYELDKQLIVQKIIKYDSINAQSFFNFRINSLKSKWKELVMLANDNYLYLLSGGNFLELVKFLLSNLNSKFDRVEVSFDNSAWNICQDGKQLPLPMLTDKKDKLDLVKTLIDFCPKKIILYDNLFVDNDTKEFLQKLFEDRLQIVK